MRLYIDIREAVCLVDSIVYCGYYNSVRIPWKYLTKEINATIPKN